VTADQNDVRRHVRKILDKLALRLADKRGGSAGSSKIKGKQERPAAVPSLESPPGALSPRRPVALGFPHYPCGLRLGFFNAGHLYPFFVLNCFACAHKMEEDAHLRPMR
jgi:hypothetical protein